MLKVIGVLWMIGVVIGYFYLVMMSEHGGGLFSAGGWGEMWLIVAACAPGYWLIKWSDHKE